MYPMKKVMLVLGTRPEAIKLCPLVRELKKREEIRCRVCATGQHGALLDQVFRTFDVIPDFRLSVMKPRQELTELTVGLLSALRETLRGERPELVVVHGDTATAFAAALASFYQGIPVAHVEAGLRTYDLAEPFPEEWNRRAVGLLAAWHFAPTERAKRNLLREGVPNDRIEVTGNTAIDALRVTVRSEYSHPELQWAANSRLLLLTLHRRESIGEPMRRCFRAIRRIVNEFPDVKLLYCAHLNPAVREIADQEIRDRARIHVIEPPDVFDFHNLLARCHLVLSDSGGIQEEAPSLGKPVLVLRNRTERPEGLEAGVTRLIGTGEGSVYRGIRELLENRALYASMARAVNPYGDGRACVRIADRIETLMGL